MRRKKSEVPTRLTDSLVPDILKLYLMIPRIPIKKVMSNALHALPPQATAAEAARVMDEKGVGSILIADGATFIGILTETDLVRKILARGMDPSSRTLESIMSYPVVAIEEDESLNRANEMMGEHQIRHLLVTRNGEPVGMVTVRNLLSSVYDWALRINL